MKFPPRHGNAGGLTDTEKMGLRSIANGVSVDTALCKRLQKLGLVELEQDVWTITQQGHVQLMFQQAR
jgi:hypothetical protein